MHVPSPCVTYPRRYLTCCGVALYSQDLNPPQYYDELNAGLLNSCSAYAAPHILTFFDFVATSIVEFSGAARAAAIGAAPV